MPSISVASDVSTNAIFNDGRTAARTEVTFEIIGDALVIIDTDGDEIDRWALVDIRYADRDDRRRFRIIGSHARLTAVDAESAGQIERACPKLKSPDQPRAWPKWAFAGIAAVASVVGIVIFLIPSFASAVVGLVPLTFERQMGLETRDQIVSLLSRRSGTHVCNAVTANAILQKRADEIATVMESPFDIEITVVDFPVTNAVTLPGGQVIILSKLLKKAKSGDEVIGILAHEIAHAVRRDPLQVSIKQTGTTLLVGLLIGDVFGGTVLTGAASTLLESGYSRDAEAAADALAVTALNRLGWNARPLASFLSRIDKETGSNLIPSFLSTHPSGEDRQKAIEDMSQGIGRALNSYEWRTVQSMCDTPA